MALVGRENTEITRWLLDTDQFKGKLRDLAKDIRKQKREEKDLELVRKELNKTTGKLSTSQKRMSSALSGLKGSLLANITAGNLLANAFMRIGSFMGEAMAQADDFSRASMAFKGNLDAARVATRGLATDLELMNTSNRLSVLGVKLSRDQYEKFLSSLTKVSRTLNVDMRYALDSATTALARQSVPMADNIGVVMKAEEAYRKYAERLGKTTNELTSLEKRQAFQLEFMDQLQAKAAELPATAKTISEEIKTITNSMMNFFTKTFSALNNYEATLKKRAQARYEKILQENLRERYGWKGDIMYAQTRGSEAMKKGGMFAEFEAEAAGLIGFKKGAGEEYTKKLGQGGIISLEERLAQTGGTATLKRKGAGRVRGVGRGVGKKAPFRAERDVAFDLEREDKVRYLGEGAMAGARGEMAEITAQSQALRQQMGILTESEQAWMRYRDAQRKSFDANKQATEYMKGVGIEALADFTGALWQVADAVIQGKASFGQAIADMLKMRLLAIAQESTVQVIFNLAQAAAQWYNPVAVANHLAAAGKFGATAAVAGGAALGLSAGMKSGSAPQTGGRSSAARDIGMDRQRNLPSFGTERKGKEEVHINVYLESPDNPSAQLLHQRQLEASFRRAA